MEDIPVCVFPLKSLSVHMTKEKTSSLSALDKSAILEVFRQEEIIWQGVPVCAS